MNLEELFIFILLNLFFSFSTEYILKSNNTINNILTNNSILYYFIIILFSIFLFVFLGLIGFYEELNYIRTSIIIGVIVPFFRIKKHISK